MDNDDSFESILKENYTSETEKKREIKRVGYAEGGEVPQEVQDFVKNVSPTTAILSTDTTANPVNNIPPEVQEFVEPELKKQKYGSKTEQFKAGLEGIAQGIAGPLAPAAEQMLGVKAEDILGREEVNPGTHYLGEIAGLGGGLLTGMGEGALLAKAGEAAATAAKLSAPVGTAAKIGSAAAKASVENALFSASDEASKAVLSDPNQSVSGAFTNIGLGGVFGAAFGTGTAAVPPLWKATFGKDTQGLLHAISNRLGGIEGVIPDSLEETVKASGLTITPEIKAGLSDDPFIRHQFQVLQEGSTRSAIKAQSALKEFRDKASDHVIELLGKDSKSISDLSSLSEYDVGNDVKKELIDNLKATADPISSRFEAIKSKFSGEKLSTGMKDKIAEELSMLADREGYAKAPSSSQNSLVQRTLRELPLQETLEDLRKYQSIINDSSFGNLELRRVGQQINRVLRDTEDGVLEEAAGKNKSISPKEVAIARTAYKDHMQLIDELNDRLHVGRYHGPDSFIKALKEMAPEDVLKRLSPKGDVELLTKLSETFPGVAEHLRQFELNKILKVAAKRAPEGQPISLSAFNTAIAKLSPEMRKFLVPEDINSKINAVEAVISGLPEKMNTSGTAKTLDALWGHVPGSATAVASMLMGHHGIAAIALLTPLVKSLGRDTPDATRLALLKFLGSDTPINGAGFKAMADYIDTSIKGENRINKAVSNVFKGGRTVIGEMASPKNKDNAKLDRMLKEIQKNPEVLQNVGKDLMHYMPDHGTQLISQSTSAADYLNSIRPSRERMAPLDPKQAVDRIQQVAYERALQMANDPLYVLDRIKSGTITSSDVTNFQKLYPGVYTNLVTKLNDELAARIAKGDSVPYYTRMGLSMFMAQPLDSTLSPRGISSAQPLPQMPQLPQAAVQTKPPAASSVKGLHKISQGSQTDQQSVQIRRQRPK